MGLLESIGLFCRDYFDGLWKHGRKPVLVAAGSTVVGIIKLAVNFSMPWPSDLQKANPWTLPAWVWFMIALVLLSYVQFRMWADEYRGRIGDKAVTKKDTENYIEHRRLEIENKRIDMESKERDWANERTTLVERNNALRNEIDKIQADLGCPSVVLRYSDTVPRPPEYIDGTLTSFWKESDLLAINESAHGAYEVCLMHAGIGRYAIYSYAQVDVEKDSRRRIPYRVMQQTTCHISIQYEHHLRSLLETEFSGDDLWEIPLSLRYKDKYGDSFESTFTLLYHPESFWLPRIEIVSGPRRLTPNEPQTGPQFLGFITHEK